MLLVKLHYVFCVKCSTPCLLIYSVRPHFLAGSTAMPDPMMMTHPLELAGETGNFVRGKIPSQTILCVEKPNDRLGRTLRVTQKALKVVGGNNLQTRIEVLDHEFASCPLVFSVKHTHGNPWGRQMIVHKNLLLACILAGIPEPPLEIPASSKKMFENTDNVSHMHSYMERVLPHIRSVVVMSI